MFSYPSQAEFNRVVPKSKIYAHSRASSRLKALFVEQVGEIIWRYKLAPETINLPARNGIEEIQVFEIVLKTPELDEAVLHSMNTAIPFPLLFQLTHKDQVRFAASYKRPSDADARKFVVEATFQTPSQDVDVERPQLPVALDLSGLYEQMVCRHIPLPRRASESLSDQVVRWKALEMKMKERRHLVTSLARARQFNRRVELNATLRSVSQDIENLEKLEQP